MEADSNTRQNRPAALMRAGAGPIAFFIPIIVASAYLNLGETCCETECPPPDFTVSVNSDEVASDGASYEGQISGDGTKVAFRSFGTNLGATIPGAGGLSSIYVRGVFSGETTHVSFWGDGYAKDAVLSFDGRYVVYLDREKTSIFTVGPWELRVHDFELGTDEVVHTGPTIGQHSVSADGDLVAINTDEALDPGDTNGVRDLYVLDRVSGAATRASIGQSGAEYDDPAGGGISAGGDWVFFNIFAADPVDDVVVLKQLIAPNEEFSFSGLGWGVDALGQKLLYTTGDDAYVFDRVAGTHTPVNLDPTGAPIVDCGSWLLSGNGEKVAFRCASAATSHGAVDQTYVRDLVQGWIKLASINGDGVPADGPTWPTSMQHNGTSVILEAVADNMHSSDVGEQVVRVTQGYWETGTVCATDDATCDGVDDDCNGQIDEEYDPQDTVCGVGACASMGTTSCVGGQVLDSCVPGTPSGGEVCDGVDNNCNGVVDEDAGSVQVTCQVGGCTAVATGPCDSTPDCTVVGVCVSEADCADAVDNDADSLTDCWDSDCAASPSCSNAAPTLNPVGAQVVTVGDILRLDLSSNDADGDPVTYSVTPLPLPANATLNGATGEFIFAPTLSQISSFALDFSVGDGRDSTTQTAVITVQAPVSGETGVKGRLLDGPAAANGEDLPVVGATIRVLGSGLNPIVTGMDGRFEFTGLTPGAVTLEFDGSSAASPPLPMDPSTSYGSYRATKNVEVGTILELSQDVYLPHIDEDADVDYDPGASGTAMLENPTLGITVEIQPGSIIDDTGSPPAGPITLTLSSVPPEFTPGALPDTLNPSTVITVQPMGLTFTTPAPITFPNELNLAPGSEVNIWSLNHSTGKFFKAGKGTVSSDGSVISSNPGDGIVETSWHFPGPPGPAGDDGDDGTGDGSSSGGGGSGSGGPDGPPEPDPCDDLASSMSLAKGNIQVNVELPPYKVLSRPFAHELVYDSSRAFPYYLLPVNSEIPLLAAVPPVVSYETTVGGVHSNDRRYIDTTGFLEGLDEPFRVVPGIDATDSETSLLPVEVRITSHYPNPTGPEATFGTIVERSLPVINGRNSPFGAGWGWSGLRRLVPVGEGAVDRLMIDGSGAYRVFRFVNGEFVSPEGDDSTLVDNGDGTITLSGTDGVEIDFDSSGSQERITFPNTNVWRYYYDQGRLSSIEDPLGGTTFIYYEGGFVTEVIDPANRKTEFDHENGDLVRVIFPDGSKREFGYDDRHLMESETSARGFTKYRHFDFAGRLDGVILEDTSEREVTLAAGHGFIPPNSSLGLARATPAPFKRPDRVTTVEDAEGRVRTFEIGAYGKVSKLTDAAGLETTMQRDEEGNLLRIARPSGQAFVMTYDGNHNMLTGKDEALDGTTVFTYQGVYDQVDTRTDALMHQTQFKYYPTGDLEKVISPLLRELTMTYYPDGNLETITDPLSRVTRFEYDGGGNLEEVTVTAGSESRTTSFMNTDSGSGYTRRVTNSLSEELVIVRDEWNRPTSLTDHAEQTTGLTYDASGNLKRLTPPFSVPPEPLHTFVYDERDWNTAYVPPKLMGQDLRTMREPDGEQQLVLESRPDGRTISFGYDEDTGRVLTRTIERGVYTVQYNLNTGQPKLMTDPDTGSLDFSYQGDWLRLVTSGSGHGILYDYKATGQIDSLTILGPAQQCDAPSVIASWQADGDSTDLVGGHDGSINGGVTFVAGVDGQAFSFDGQDTWVDATVPLDGVDKFSFAMWFRMFPRVGGQGVAFLRYNTSPSIAAFSVIAYSDNIDVFGTGFGSLDTGGVAYDDGQWHHLVATRDNLWERLYVDGTEVDSFRELRGPIDTNGELLIGCNPSRCFQGDIDGFTVYDRALSAAEVAQLHAQRKVNPCEPGEVLSQAGYSYDADGAVEQAGDVTMAYYPATGLLQTVSLDDLTKTYTYTGFGEVFTESTEVGATLTDVHQVSYDVYDSLGRVKQTTESIQGGVAVTHDYVYDAAGRLEQVLVDGIEVEHYTYDDNGNRLTALGVSPIEYDAQDRLTRYGGNAYTYLDSGELLTKTNSEGQTTYDYDEFGNLLSVVLPNSSVVEYEIDALDRRVGRKFNGQVTHRWIYQDQLNPVAELDADGNLAAVFIYGTRAHVPDAMIKNGTRYLFVTDHVGSVRVVVNAETGAVVQSIEYDAWGNVTSGNLGFQPFGFAGGLYDQNTRLVRFGARDYDAYTGRWTSKDPILFWGGDTNLYAYLRNDPVNFIDPSGLYSNVYVWDPVGGGKSSFGHVSVDVNGTTYSFGPGGNDVGDPWHITRNNQFRGADILGLNLTDEQEEALDRALDRNQNDYDSLTNNCGDPLERALEELGLDLGVNITPAGLVESLEDTGAIGEWSRIESWNPYQRPTVPWAGK